MSYTSFSAASSKGVLPIAIRSWYITDEHHLTIGPSEASDAQLPGKFGSPYTLGWRAVGTLHSVQFQY